MTMFFDGVIEETAAKTWESEEICYAIPHFRI